MYIEWLLIVLLSCAYVMERKKITKRNTCAVDSLENRRDIGRLQQILANWRADRVLGSVPASEPMNESW